MNAAGKTDVADQDRPDFFSPLVLSIRVASFASVKHDFIAKGQTHTIMTQLIGYLARARPRRAGKGDHRTPVTQFCSRGIAGDSTSSHGPALG